MNRTKFGRFIGRFSKFRETERNWTEERQEIENEWKASREIQEANSSDKIDQLSALRFEMRSGKHSLYRGKVGKFRKMKCLVWEIDSERRNLQQIWGRCEEIEIEAIENMLRSRGCLFRKYRMRNP